LPVFEIRGATAIDNVVVAAEFLRTSAASASCGRARDAVRLAAGGASSRRGHILRRDLKIN
jgi:hypothetical protein